LNNTRITVRFDGKLLRNLDRLRRELGQSRSEIARDAIRLHLAGLAGFRAQVFRRLDQLAAARGLETALHRDVRVADKQIAAGKSVSHASVARKLRARLIGERRWGASS